MTLNALQAVARVVARPVIRASMPSSSLTMDDWIDMMSLDRVPMLSTTLKVDQENIDGSFLSLVQGAYRSNGVVFATIAARFLLFSEARFAYQQMRGSRPGNLFGTPALSILEAPEPGRTTSDLLGRMMLDNDLAGIWFGLLRGGTIKRLRPDWTSAVFGSKRKGATPQDPDSHLAGFSFMRGGPGGDGVEKFLPEEVAHYSTTPDGIRNYVGMPWLTPVLKEILADSAGTNLKLAYYRNSATPNLTVTMPVGMAKEKAEEWIELFEQEHRGALNAFKTIYFGGGATAQVIGANLGELDFRKIQAGDEARIIAAGGLHPSLFGLGDIAGGGLNTGNMPAIVRWIADSTMRPAWRNAAGSLAWLLGTPSPAVRLWYDDRDVPFLRDDVRDSARATQLHGSTVGGLINNGFLPDDAVDAVMANDLRRLIGKHSGLVSVQLQPPGNSAPLDGAGDGVPPAGEEPAAMVARTRIVGAGTVHSAIEELRTAIGGSALVRSADAFWPLDGPFRDVGEVPKGVVLPGDHPIAGAFPAMFAPVPSTARSDATGVRCPKGHKVAVRLAPGSIVECRVCKAEVVA